MERQRITEADFYFETDMAESALVRAIEQTHGTLEGLIGQLEAIRYLRSQVLRSLEDGLRVDFYKDEEGVSFAAQPKSKLGFYKTVDASIKEV